MHILIFPLFDQIKRGFKLLLWKGNEKLRISTKENSGKV